MSKKICATLWEGFDKVIEARAALQTLLENSDDDGINTKQVQSAIAALQNNNAEYQERLKNSATLPDGTPIHATDYLALCKLATDNNLELDKVLIGIRGNSISSTGRVIIASLSDIGISNISALKHLTALTILCLQNNKIKDISPIKDLTALTTLDLHSNQIKDITPITNLTALTELWLNDNQINDIGAIKNLTALTTLWLSNNQIVDINSIKNLTALTELWLYNNQIEDISPIKDLPIFNSSNFTFWKNPLSEASKALLEARRTP